MAGKVFINYRRDEAAGVAGRLYDLLSKEFDEQNVFMDVDSIQPGLDYIEQLDDQVANCGILLAVIGPRWVGATDATGQRRLDKPDDFVRVEIASALKRDIPVIPVLLDGARLPQESELPEDLKALTRRQAVELRHSHFAADSEVIVRSVRKVLPGGAWLTQGSQPQSQPSSWPAGLIGCWGHPAIPQLAHRRRNKRRSSKRRRAETDHSKQRDLQTAKPITRRGARSRCSPRLIASVPARPTNGPIWGHASWTSGRNSRRHWVCRFSKGPSLTKQSRIPLPPRWA